MRLELENVLAFASLQMDLRPLTILSGENSAGKSSILHSLAVLRQSYQADTLPQSLLLNGMLVRLGIGRDVLHGEPVAEGGVEDLHLAIRVDECGYVARYESDADVLELADAPSETPSIPLFSPHFQYLRADRIVPAVTYPKSHEAVAVEGSLGSQGEHTANYLRVHGNQRIRCEFAALESAPGPTLREQVNGWLDRLSLGTQVDVLDVEGTDFVRLSYRNLGRNVPSSPHRATNVGFGLTYVLPIIVGCLMAEPGSLIMVENPESHLHPRAQSLIGGLCAAAAAGSAHVVVETHSDHFLNAIRMSVKQRVLEADQVGIYFFSRSSEWLQPDVQSITIGADGMLPEWPRGFFDEFEKTVMDLLE